MLSSIWNRGNDQWMEDVEANVPLAERRFKKKLCRLAMDSLPISKKKWLEILY